MPATSRCRASRDHFHGAEDEPQYTALIHRWDVNPKLSDDLFEFHPPQAVRKVDFLDRHAEPQPLHEASRQVTWS